MTGTQGSSASGEGTNTTSPDSLLADRWQVVRRKVRGRSRFWRSHHRLGMVLGAGFGAAALSLWPAVAPLEAAPANVPATAPGASIAAPATISIADEYRSQMIRPLALGGESGRHMGAGNLVRPLTNTPERPQINLSATLGGGADSLGAVLARAGVSGAQTAQALNLVAGAVPLAELAAGTPVDITLGRRAEPGQPRPLEELRFRARFDLNLTVRGSGMGLALEREPIRVDETPLRIRGTVDGGLYSSARAAGAPAEAVQAYLRTLAQHTDVAASLAAGDVFDIVVAHRRAATGERQVGPLLYAGLEKGGKPRLQLLRWGNKGEFFDAAGVGRERGGFTQPVAGSVSSQFGMRRHPILGFRRMHAGLDFRAGYGSPIVAVADGRVQAVGRMGGCGIAVRLAHGGNLSTRYCHMSRMAVRGGQSVRRGQVIGYVGSTGLSTGAHLHYEMYRGGQAVNPLSVRFVARPQLEGAELARFRGQLARLKAVEPGAALAELEASAPARAEPVREIDRLAPQRTAL